MKISKEKVFSQKGLDKSCILMYNIRVAKATRLMREWRNWQTRTFEGRVDSPYGFKSRFSHQYKHPKGCLLFICGYVRAHSATPTQSLAGMCGLIPPHPHNPLRVCADSFRHTHTILCGYGGIGRRARFRF